MTSSIKWNFVELLYFYGSLSRKKIREVLCSIGNIHLSKPKKMTQVLFRTIKLLGVAFIIHFIVISTFAETEENSKELSFLSPGSITENARRRPRSYRNDMELSGGGNVASGNLVGLGSTGPNSRQPDKSEAIFTTENSTTVTAQEGSTASLPCIVRNLGNGVASWLRRRDYSLLTVGMGTISHDERFYVSHSRTTQNWELHIKFVKSNDEGWYECQISTHPPSSIFVQLRVVEAKAEILGEPDKHVRSGSTFELVCVLRDSTEPPVFVFWYHNERMINYDLVRGVVVNNDAEKSILIIEDAQKNDSGNYTCTPSNAKPTSITVHILNGEKPAAMQHGFNNHSSSLAGFSWISLMFVSLLLTSSILIPGLDHSSENIKNNYPIEKNVDYNPLCGVGKSSDITNYSHTQNLHSSELEHISFLDLKSRYLRRVER